MHVRVVEPNGDERSIHIDSYPDVCPACQNGIRPVPLTGWRRHYKAKAFVAYVCPIAFCDVIFTGIYNKSSHTSDSYQLSGSKFLTLVTKPNIPETIQDLSPDYCEIFFQAKLAEDNGLRLVAGPGYRKALEFLIKDYLIKYKYNDEPEQQELVRKYFLGVCIKEHIEETRIQACAERATWLGNDETHYSRKWEEKDMNDLKTLLAMTKDWIDLSIQSDRYLEGMKEGKK